MRTPDFFSRGPCGRRAHLDYRRRAHLDYRRRAHLDYRRRGDRTYPFLGRTGLIVGLYGVVFHGEYARDVR